MPRTEEANQRIREEQREKILDAARKVLARKGNEATMADIAAEAEVSQGLAYRYFANKEALLHELAKRVTQAIVATLQRIKEMPGTPGERLTFLISRIVKGQRDHPEHFQLLNRVFAEEVISEDLRELVRKQNQTVRDAVRQLIVEAQATGEVAADDPDQLVTILMASLEGLTHLATRHPERFKQHVPDARLLLRILKPQAD